MRKHGKKYRAAAEKIEEGRKYTLDEGVALSPSLTRPSS
jgi:ribosomal protein L1